MISPVGNNSSLSSFLSSLTEDKEITTFEIVSDNARSSRERLMSDLHFSPEPKEAKCRWKNLVRMDSDDDMMRHAKRGGPTRGLRGSGRSGGVGRRSSLTFSSSDRPAFTRVSSDPLLMPRRRLSPERVTGNRTYPNDQYSSQGQSKIQKGAAIAASDTNLLRMPQRKPSPHTDRSSLLSSSSNHNNSNASWNLETKQEKKNMLFKMMMTPDLCQLESSSSSDAVPSSKPPPSDKPISPPRRSHDDDVRNISDDDESDVETVESTTAADDDDGGGEMSNELKGGSKDMVTWGTTETEQPKMVASKALLMKQSMDGFPASNKMKKTRKSSFDRMDRGLQSKAKMYGLY